VRAAQAASLEGWRASSPGPSPFEGHAPRGHLRVMGKDMLVVDREAMRALVNFRDS
jgi:hypothetical protein